MSHARGKDRDSGTRWAARPIARLLLTHRHLGPVPFTPNQAPCPPALGEDSARLEVGTRTGPLGGHKRPGLSPRRAPQGTLSAEAVRREAGGRAEPSSGGGWQGCGQGGQRHGCLRGSWGSAGTQPLPSPQQSGVSLAEGPKTAQETAVLSGGAPGTGRQALGPGPLGE